MAHQNRYALRCISDRQGGSAPEREHVSDAARHENFSSDSRSFSDRLNLGSSAL